MADRQYVLSSAGGALKSIPLSAFPAEAWRSMMSQFTSDDELIKRYNDTPWFRRAIDVIASTLANLPWAFVHDNGDELPEGELPELPFALNMDSVLNTLGAWLELYGAAYLFIGRNGLGMVKELRPMHPSTITPHFDAAQGLTGFTRKLGAQSIPLRVDEVCYIWLPSRASEVGPGTAPAKTALLAALLLNSGDGFMKMYFDNGVIAPTLLIVPDAQGDPDKDRLEEWLRRSASGIKKAFSVFATRRSVEVKPLGEQIPLGSLAMPELTDKKREDISTAFGIPQSLLFSNAANYATAQQDDLHFYDKTVVPLGVMIAQALTEQVFSRLGWTLKFKPESLECYQQLEMQKAIALGGLYDRDIYTREEVRDEMGREPVPTMGQFKSDTRTANAVAIAQARPVVTVPQQGQVVDAQAVDVTNQKALQDPISADLGRWQRKAIRRVEEGKADRAREFESDVLSDRIKAYIVGALDGVTDVDGVKQVFTLAEQWSVYP